MDFSPPSRNTEHRLKQNSLTSSIPGLSVYEQVHLLQFLNQVQKIVQVLQTPVALHCK